MISVKTINANNKYSQFNLTLIISMISIIVVVYIISKPEMLVYKQDGVIVQ